MRVSTRGLDAQRAYLKKRFILGDISDGEFSRGILRLISPSKGTWEEVLEVQRDLREAYLRVGLRRRQEGKIPAWIQRGEIPSVTSPDVHYYPLVLAVQKDIDLIRGYGMPFYAQSLEETWEEFRRRATLGLRHPSAYSLVEGEVRVPEIYMVRVLHSHTYFGGNSLNPFPRALLLKNFVHGYLIREEDL